MKTKYFPLATASLVLTALLANQITVSAQETAPTNYAVESNNDVPNEARATNPPAEENSVSVSDEKAHPAPEAERDINNNNPTDEAGSQPSTDEKRDHIQPERAATNEPLSLHERELIYAQGFTKANKESILKSYNENKGKLVDTVIINDKYVDNPRIDRKDYKKANEISIKDVSQDIAIKEAENHYLDLNKKLDSELLLESELNLNQKDVKEKTMDAVKALRAHMWDIDHGLNALEEVYDPKTGKKINGIWVKGERLTERAHAAGINTKEDYINNIQWNRELEDTALQNLAEIVNIHTFYRTEYDYSEPDRSRYNNLDKFFSLDYKEDSNFENHLLNNFIYPEIINHNRRYGNDSTEKFQTVGNIINLLLDPFNRSLAVAANKPYGDYGKFVALASPTQSENTSSSNYTGLGIVIVNGNKDKIEKYDVNLPDQLYENTSQRLNINVTSQNSTRKQKIYGLNFSGKITSMNPEILEIDDHGIIHAKQAGVADIILSINGIVQRKKLEVLPRPYAKDTIYYRIETHYEDTEYRENPNMLMGEEKVIQEYRPDIHYYVERFIEDKKGTLKVQVEKILTIPWSKKIVEYGTKVLEDRYPEKVEPETPSKKPAKPANEAKPEENNNPKNSIGVIFGRPYENNPGYIELLPGYYVQLEPEHEDQTIRINEKEFETEIRTNKDLKAGEYRIIQQGQNAYIALTNRVYKDHLGNVLKTQELGRQRVEGKPLIIEVGVESNGQPTVSIDKPETKTPETTMPSDNNSDKNKNLPDHKLENNMSPSTEHKPVEGASIHVDSTPDSKEVHDRKVENNSSSTTDRIEEASIKVDHTNDIQGEGTGPSTISYELTKPASATEGEGDSINAITSKATASEESRGEASLLEAVETITKPESNNSITKYVSTPLSNSNPEISSSTKEQDSVSPVLNSYAKDTYKGPQNYRQPQEVASILPATGTLDNRLPLAIGVTTVLTGLLSFKVSRRRSH
ncbi:hypothetical protein [Aerococcus tenax]|uniref:hypothetical protein n=1 Tax=Aerococcus tenax TaxID=3078812 RepID=UPI0018A7CDE9|nr:hypothetical protein [Aerococcus tenax]